MSLSETLSALLNPTPRAVDPEDADTGYCRARLAECSAQDEGEEENVGPSALRRRTAPAESDARYRGLIATRRDLRRLGDEDDEDDKSDDDDGGHSVGAASEACTEEEEDGASENASVTRELAHQAEQHLHPQDEDDDDSGGDGEDDGDDDDDEDDEDDGIVMDEEEVTSEEERLSQREHENEGVATFQSEETDDEVAKGRAIKCQIGLWDHLLEARIKMQRALEVCNRLPQADALPGFKAHAADVLPCTLDESRSALLELMRLLVDLQNHLLHSNPDTRHMVDGNSMHSGEEQTGSAAQPDGARTPRKRALLMDDYPDFSAKRFATYKDHRNAVIQKWHDKTKLSGGKMKGFASFERSVLLQIEHVLQERDRLVLRTQTKRSAYTVLGKAPAEEISSSVAGTDESQLAEVAPQTASQLKDIDPEVFDDGDFYHQLLRELIECKTASADSNDQLAWGRQWLEIQKLRSKVKKKVDTKASKGRKIRYTVHSKLLSFMAPIDNSCMNDEARTELFRSLFGKSQRLEVFPAP